MRACGAVVVVVLTVVIGFMLFTFNDAQNHDLSLYTATDTPWESMCFFNDVECHMYHNGCIYRIHNGILSIPEGYYVTFIVALRCNGVDGISYVETSVHVHYVSDMIFIPFPYGTHGAEICHMFLIIPEQKHLSHLTGIHDHRVQMCGVLHDDEI